MFHCNVPCLNSQCAKYLCFMRLAIVLEIRRTTVREANTWGPIQGPTLREERKLFFPLHRDITMEVVNIYILNNIE